MHKLPQSRRAINNRHSGDADTNEKIIYVELIREPHKPKTPLTFRPLRYGQTRYYKIYKIRDLIIIIITLLEPMSENIENLKSVLKIRSWANTTQTTL